MNNARTAAFAGLKALRISKTWPDQYVKLGFPKLELSAQDTALAVNLLYGTIENISLIDFYISNYSSIKLKKIMPQVLDILRLGVYQIVYLTKIPDNAAVSESVSLARKNGGDRASAFVNAILRKICGAKENLPEPNREDFANFLAIKYTHPLWFVEKMIAKLGKDSAEQLLIANSINPKTTARVNTLKISTGELLEVLKKEGANATAHEFLDNCIVFESLGNITALLSFKQGLFYIQDVASQLALCALGVMPNSDVIDMCAAPGGKSLIAAQMQQCKGELLACDVHEFKAKVIAENAVKYGCTNVSVRVCDSSIAQEDIKDAFDYIICDVPCSGMGIIRKKCDIRFKDEKAALELPELQEKILSCAATYCRKGGYIVYSTCTVLSEENEDVVNSFLSANTAFKCVPFDLPGIGNVDGMITLYPHTNNTDGFFIAKLQRI